MVAALGDRVPRIAPTAWVHPFATIVGDVEIGEQTNVWPGAVLRGDFGSIRVGDRTSIQDNVVVHSSPDLPTEIGDDCIIAHLAFVEAAIVGDACMVAVGAKVLPRSSLQAGSVAAAGAVLARGIVVPSGHRAQGVPASVFPISRPDREATMLGARHYAEMARRYEAAGIGCLGADLGAGPGPAEPPVEC